MKLQMHRQSTKHRVAGSNRISVPRTLGKTAEGLEQRTALIAQKDEDQSLQIHGNKRARVAARRACKLTCAGERSGRIPRVVQRQQAGKRELRSDPRVVSAPMQRGGGRKVMIFTCLK